MPPKKQRLGAAKKAASADAKRKAEASRKKRRLRGQPRRLSLPQVTWWQLEFK
jgi:hypothetical protein